MKFLKKLFGSKIDNRDEKKALDDELKLWRILTVTKDDQALVVRIRIEKPDYEDINEYKEAVVIKWPYKSHDENPMPPKDVNQKQVVFEKAIDDLTGDNDLSYLIQVGTGMGLKEWVFYTKNKEDFMKEFNQSLQGHDAYPLEIEFYDDPEWKIWIEFLDLYKRGAAKKVK